MKTHLSGISFLQLFASFPLNALPCTPTKNLPKVCLDYRVHFRVHFKARADITLDVLNDRIVEAEFGSLSGDERSMAIEHIRKLKGRIRMEDAAFLFDRRYPSKEMTAAILQAGGALLCA